MPQPSRPSRRDLFRIPSPKNLGGTTGSGARTSATNHHQEEYLEQYAARAMGCEFEFSFNLRQYPQAAAAAMDALDLVSRLERQMTVYSPDSELSQLNQTAQADWRTVEPALFDLLEQAREIWQRTGGAFDITAGPLWAAWGFDQRSGRVPEAPELAQAKDQVGSQHWELDGNRCRLRINRPGVSLNLGAIGKGHAIDRSATLLRSRDVADFLIHGGQSSILAWGNSRQTNLDGDDSAVAVPAGWSIGLSHPTAPDQRLAEIQLHNRALGTSGSGRQGFFYQGKRFGHIIDPRTGWPPDHFLSTTVLADSAAVADALATAFYVMSLDQIESYCQAHPDIAALIVQPSGKTQGQVLLTTFNMEPNQIQVFDA